MNSSGSGFSLKDFLFRQASLYDGRHLLDKRTTSTRSARISANSEEPVFLEADGEYLGRLPASFRILPRAVKIILPGGADV